MDAKFAAFKPQKLFFQQGLKVKLHQIKYQVLKSGTTVNLKDKNQLNLSSR